MVRPDRTKLSGVVEVDDALVGGVEDGIRGRGRKTEKKAKIVVAVEVQGRQLGRVRMRHIPNFSADQLLSFIKENVEPGSDVRTDGLEAYRAMEGYRHQRHVVGLDPRRAARLLPNVHRIIALLKRWLLGTHQGAVSTKHLQHYLDEFVFRFNRRRSRHVGKIFFRTAERAAMSDHVPYRQLIRDEPERDEPQDIVADQRLEE
jgi:transposase-like protein